MRNYIKKLLVALMAGLVLMPSAVLASPEAGQGPIQQNTPPLLVHDLEATLVALGCRPVQLDDAKIKAATSAGWLAVVPADATGETLVFCPPEAIGSVRPLGNGQVEGWRWVGKIIKTVFPAAAVLEVVDYLFLDGAIGDTVVDAALGVVEGSVVWTVQQLLYYVFLFLALLGNMLSNWFAQYIPKLLIQPEFVQAGIVQSLWPLVLTIVNMGFMIALVFIALLTTLRLDVAGGIRRLLPRLLIAALLVNFSLVIAGVILDMSRIVMSGTSVLLELPDIDALPEKIIAVSGQLNLFINTQEGLTGDDLSGWDASLAVGLSAVATWAMAIALLVVIIGLIVRYIFIIVLLIISPVAYVMLAFPGMASLGKKWWVTFLKYVIYGPVVLFFILAAVFSLGTNNEIRNLFDVTSSNIGDSSGMQAVKGGVVNVIMFVVFFILAAMAGKHAGIVGSATALSVVASGGKRARGMLYRGAARGGKAVGRRAVRPVRDFGRGVSSGLRARLPKALQPVKRDKDGKPVLGQPKTYGERLGGGVVRGKQYNEQRKQTREAKAFVPTGATPAALARSVTGSAAWAPTRLKEAHVGGALSETQRRNVMGMGGRAQKVSLAGNKEAVRNMTEGEKNLILNMDVNLPTNLSTSTGSSTTDATNGATNTANQTTNSINKDVQKAFQNALNTLDKEKG